MNVRELHKNALDAFHFCLLRLIPGDRHARQYLMRLTRNYVSVLFWAPEITITPYYREFPEHCIIVMPAGWESIYPNNAREAFKTKSSYRPIFPNCDEVVKRSTIDFIRLNAWKTT